MCHGCSRNLRSRSADEEGNRERLGCPEQAITKVPRRFVALLEYAMAKSKRLGGRDPWELGEAPVDQELREEYEEMTSMVLKDPGHGSTAQVPGGQAQEDKKREAADIIAKNGRPLSQAGDDDDIGGAACEGPRL
eukprot:Skav230295  [mRNA]  locus=scaffold2934:141046:145747:- [translate_table: standard]